MRTGRPERLKSFNYRGLRRYFLTFCTLDRRPYFLQPDLVQLCRTQIERTAVAERFAVIAYCFMPDHVHLLVEGKSTDADCRSFIKRAKQVSGYHHKRTYGSPLWQRYAYERILREEDDTLAVVRYICENPVRAGLVERPQDYPFLGSEHPIEHVLEAVQWSAPRST